MPRTGPLAAWGAAALLVVLLCAPGAACGAGITFHVLSQPGSEEHDLLGRLVGEFNRAHPGADVALRGGRLPLEHVMRNIIARRAAQVIEIRAGEVPFLADRGALKDLTADCGSLGPFIHAHPWSHASRSNHLYAVPWAALPKLLLYNRAAFRAAGLPDDRPPRTWPELRAAAAKLTNGVIGDGKANVYGFALAGKRSADIGRHFATFLAQKGPDLLAFRKGRWFFNIDRKEGREVMAFLVQLQKVAPLECVVSDDHRTLKQFRSGTAAMVLCGPSGLQPGEGGARAVDIGVAPVPAPRDGRSRCDVELRYGAIPAFASGPQEQTALDLLRFLAGRTAQDIVARGVKGSTPVIAVRRDVLAGDGYQKHPQLSRFANSLEDAAPVIPSFVWEGRCLEDWAGPLHALLLADTQTEGKIREMALLAQTRGDQGLSCLFTAIGHPSATMTLGMTLVAVLVFGVVAYAVSRH